MMTIRAILTPLTLFPYQDCLGVRGQGPRSLNAHTARSLSSDAPPPGRPVCQPTPPGQSPASTPGPDLSSGSANVSGLRVVRWRENISVGRTTLDKLGGVLELAVPGAERPFAEVTMP